MKEYQHLYELVFREKGTVSGPQEEISLCEFGADDPHIARIYSFEMHPDRDGEHVATVEFVPVSEEDDYEQYETDDESEQEEEDDPVNEMPYIERMRAYEKIIDKYKPYNQIGKAIEEMSELIKPLSEFMRLAQLKEALSIFDVLAQRNNLIEEIADVTIMMEQMRLIFFCNDEVKKVMRQKIERTLKRMGS